MTPTRVGRAAEEAVRVALITELSRQANGQPRVVVVGDQYGTGVWQAGLRVLREAGDPHFVFSGKLEIHFRPSTRSAPPSEAGSPMIRDVGRSGERRKSDGGFTESPAYLDTTCLGTQPPCRRYTGSTQPVTRPRRARRSPAPGRAAPTPAARRRSPRAAGRPRRFEWVPWWVLIRPPDGRRAVRRPHRGAQRGRHLARPLGALPAVRGADAVDEHDQADEVCRSRGRPDGHRTIPSKGT